MALVVSLQEADVIVTLRLRGGGRETVISGSRSIEAREKKIGQSVRDRNTTLRQTAAILSKFICVKVQAEADSRRSKEYDEGRLPDCLCLYLDTASSVRGGPPS